MSIFDKLSKCQSNTIFDGPFHLDFKKSKHALNRLISCLLLHFPWQLDSSRIVPIGMYEVDFEVLHAVGYRQFPVEEGVHVPLRIYRGQCPEIVQMVTYQHHSKTIVIRYPKGEADNGK